MKSNAADYNNFSKGIDLRKSATVSEANRLRFLENCYVTDGGAIRKREGLKRYASLGENTSGILQFQGSPSTVSFGAENTNVSSFEEVPNKVFTFVDEEGFPLSGLTDYVVEYSDTFKGQLFVICSAQSDEGEIVKCFYNGVQVQDTLCPNTKSAVKLAGRLYMINGDVVSYCAVDNPLDWTSTNDAGFLPTGLQTSGENIATAVDEYEGFLAVFMPDAIQLWVVDQDPSLSAFQKTVQNIGTRYHKSIAKYSTDLLFLSEFGFRSVGRQAYTDSIEDNDVGSPIDKLVREELKTADPTKIKSVYYPKGSQYLCFLGTKIFVFRFSRSAKINAWSVYSFEGREGSFDDIVVANGDLFLWKDGNMFVLDDETYVDDGVEFEVNVEMSFLSQKTQGVGKRYMGFDLVQEGKCSVSFSFDSLDETNKSVPFEVVGNTRPRGRMGLSAVSTEIAPIFSNTSAQPWQLDGIVLYYTKLGIHV